MSILHFSTPTYRKLGFAALYFGLVLLFVANGAVGIIGSENNPANLLYASVFVAAVVGSLFVRFSPYRMMWVSFLTAIVHMSVPVFALFIWPAQVSWGDAGVFGVLFLNTLFSGIFFLSGYFFQKALSTEKAHL